MSKNGKKGLKKKNIRKLIICILLVAGIIGGYFIYTKYFKKSDTVEAPKVVDKIETKSFNYVVSENDTKLFKTTFEELKKVLTADTIDNKEYAKVISKLFVIDFYTLSNKTSKNDIGGIQFIYSSYKSDFIDYARDGMYKQVKNAIDGDSNSSLPTVKEVNVSNIEEVSPSAVFSGIEFPENAVGYQLTLDWTYEKGDDFQTKATITVVTDGEKLSLAKLENE